LKNPLALQVFIWKKKTSTHNEEPLVNNENNASEIDGQTEIVTNDLQEAKITDSDLNNNEQVDLDNSGMDQNEDEDQGNWITPSNLDEIKKLHEVEAEQQRIKDMRMEVGCMTSDFAMQNVLIQIGIPVLSVDGLLVKIARSYVLRCITCMKVTTNMQKQFCPSCGYKTLERVIVTVDEDGNKVYRGRRKAASTKGLRYSLPTPDGGKHPIYPQLSEDQPRAQNFPSKKSMIRSNPLDPDYESLNSPFAIKDIYSRAARLGIRAGKDNYKLNKKR